MRSRLIKFPRVRMVALAVGVGAIGSLATAPASFAVGARPQPPAVGANCQQDGKINGAGSSFQTNAFNNALIYGFQQDVCGPIGTASSSILNPAYASDPSIYTATYNNAAASVSGMLAYNYSLNGVAALPGSGAGLKRISCRTDFFAGTDLPYDSTQLGTPGNGAVAGLDGPPGSESGGTAPTYNCQTQTAINTTAVPPPFGPQTPGGYPNTSDTAKNIMSFPIGGGGVAIAVNLNGMCTVATPGPGTISLTSDEFNKIMQGTINQWNDPELVATNSILSTDNCKGNIQRVVRFDNSGTTAITMFTLDGINTFAGSPPLCNGVASWISIAISSNNSGQWPVGPNCKDASGNLAPAPITSGTNGSNSLIATLNATNGGIGYAELGLWGTLPAGVQFAKMETQTATSFNGLTATNPTVDANGKTALVSAGSPGAASNCVIPQTGLPGSGGANDAVGLGPVTWANDATPPPKPDIAFQGSGYPNCGLTFDLVYTGMHTETGEAPGTTPGCTGTTITGACQTVSGPMIGATNDQLRTLYSFFTYVFSPLGQSYLGQATYDQLPATWLPPLTQGYQNNF